MHDVFNDGHPFIRCVQTLQGYQGLATGLLEGLLQSDGNFLKCLHTIREKRRTDDGNVFDTRLSEFLNEFIGIGL